MGLGKTIQAIALFASIYPDEKKPSLILMPKTLLFNWANELEKFSPQLSYFIHHGSNRNLSDAKTSQIILTTYATMRNDIEEFKEEEFHYIILDESQNIKNLNNWEKQTLYIEKERSNIIININLLNTTNNHKINIIYTENQIHNKNIEERLDSLNQINDIKEIIYNLSKSDKPKNKLIVELVKQFDIEDGTIFLQNITSKQMKLFDFNQFRNNNMKKLHKTNKSVIDSGNGNSGNGSGNNGNILSNNYNGLGLKKGSSIGSQGSKLINKIILFIL